MTNSEKRTIENKSKRSLALFLLLVLLILGGFWYFYDSGKKPQAISPASTPQTEIPGEGLSDDKTGTAKGEQPDAAGSGESGTAALSECGKTAEQIQKFFAHLDNSDYVAARNLPGGSHAYFSGLTDKLLASSPVLTGEKENLQALLSNTAHFYRKLKITDIALIKEILANENDSLEETMALFYNWLKIAPKCPNSGVLVKLPLPGLYEYAGFFLNTLGGQSYLFRRDSRTRLLVKFYSIKIMDQAEDASLNRYGIDFRPAINSLLEEMKSAPNLAKKDDYLAELIALQDKYAQKFGAQTAAPPKQK